MNQTDTTFQVPAGWRRPKTHFMDAHWKDSLSKMVKDNLSGMTDVEKVGHKELVRRLLAIGGDGVALRYEEDLDQLLEKAVISKGSKSRMMKGRPCNCHRNAANLWYNNRNNEQEVRIATGWALSRDGCWRQHSWAVQLLVNWDVSGYQILETTVRRMVYYGFTLSKEQCETFYSNQQ